MATLPDVEAPVASLVSRLAELDPELRRRHMMDRMVSCRVSDLRTTWSARRYDDGLVDVGAVAAPPT